MSDWKIRFGTAGTSDSFTAQGYKSSLDVPEYTAKMGLNAFEYQCGRGVRLGLDKAAKMAALAGPKDILFSVHAPYYISMSSLEEDKRLKVAGYACTVLENDVFEYPAEKPFGYMTEALDDLKPNEIYIATGAHNSALWGELLTACGKARGAVGAVLDGYTRDTPKVIEQNFPVFCSGTWAQDSSVRTYVFKWRCPIEIGQVTIHNGDIVFGDIDGVLIIPKDIAPEVIEKALVKASTEKTMRKAIEDGMMVTDAFAKFGVL